MSSYPSTLSNLWVKYVGGQVLKRIVVAIFQSRIRKKKIK